MAIFRPKTGQKHPRSLQAWMQNVALVSVAGALAIAALVGWYSWYEQKLYLNQNMVATTRAIIELTDREIDRATTIARVTAASTLWRSAEHAISQERAQALVRPFGYFLIISESRSTRELYNSDVPPGVALPDLPQEWVGSAGVEPIVRPLVFRNTDRNWAAAVQVLASPKVGRPYVITIGIPAWRFQTIIDAQRLPPEWSPVITDQDWTIVARGITPEHFIGKKAANPQIQNLPGPDSTYQGRVLEGYLTVNARSHSDQTGWTAAIAVPQLLIYSEALTRVLLVATVGFFVSLLTFFVIGKFSKHFAHDVALLSKATEKLSNDKISTISGAQIAELDKVLGAIQDASKRITEEEYFRKRTIEELAHRLQNKIATIQAILTFQLKDHPRVRDIIYARLNALAQTDKLIIAAQGRGADLRDIIVTEMRAYDASRATAVGQDVFLEPKLAITLALIFHELATNAAKYGSLSDCRGHVSIQWSVQNSILMLQWRETGGPAVSEPIRKGFGTKLITSALESFGGRATTRFEPAGLVVEMTAVISDSPPFTVVPSGPISINPKSRQPQPT